MTREQYNHLFSPMSLEALSLEAARPVEPPLNVTRFDGDWRFLVRSQVRPDVHYLVELDDPAFPNGRCGCEQFWYRVEPKLVRGLTPVQSECKHCRVVASKLEHAMILCEAAGLDFSPRIIPTQDEYRGEFFRER